VKDRTPLPHAWRKEQELEDAAKRRKRLEIAINVLLLVAVVVTLLLVCGCASRTEVHAEKDTKWNGSLTIPLPVQEANGQYVLRPTLVSFSATKNEIADTNSATKTGLDREEVLKLIADAAQVATSVVPVPGAGLGGDLLSWVIGATGAAAAVGGIVKAKKNSEALRDAVSFGRDALEDVTADEQEAVKTKHSKRQYMHGTADAIKAHL